MAHAIGIDVGTTNVKVVLVSSEGTLVASGARTVATRRNGDEAELDAEALWNAVKGSIAETAAAAPEAASDVVAIGCCSQYSSIVAVGPDATPVADMVLWQDKRGTDHSWALLEREGAFETWHERHGIPPVGHRACRSAHMLHLQHDRPDVHEATAAWLEAMDYVNAPPDRPHRCHPVHDVHRASCATTARSASPSTTASCSRMSGVDADRLPPLVDPNAVGRRAASRDGRPSSDSPADVVVMARDERQPRRRRSPPGAFDAGSRPA